MGKKNWTLSSALRAVGGTDEKRKLVRLDGKLTLGTSGAVDYLKKEHGYRVI